MVGRDVQVVDAGAQTEGSGPGRVRVTAVEARAGDAADGAAYAPWLRVREQYPLHYAFSHEISRELGMARRRCRLEVLEATRPLDSAGVLGMHRGGL
jgi:hypothetical protein